MTGNATCLGAGAAPSGAPACPSFYKADDQKQLIAQVSGDSSATALVTITSLDHSGDEGSPRLLGAADCASVSSSPCSAASVAIHFAGPAAAPGAAAVGAAEARRHGVWRSVVTFMAAVQTSPLLASALTSMGAAGTEPVADARTGLRGLRWTLAALLALHLRSGRAVATEDDLLASLWTLESWWDAWRSSASTVLGDYVKHVAVFDEQRARRMAANWREEFFAWRSSVVGSQRALLAAVDWNVRLDAAADLLPCYAMLFGEQEGEWARLFVSPDGSDAEALQPRAAASAVPPSETAWAERMDGYCQRITHQAHRIKAGDQAAQLAVHAGSESAVPSAKRHRHG